MESGCPCRSPFESRLHRPVDRRPVRDRRRGHDGGSRRAGARDAADDEGGHRRRPARRTSSTASASVLQRGRRPDAVDPETGERLDDVLMFRVADLDVKELMLADDRGVYFTTPHFKGYPAVLVRIPRLERLDRDELHDLVAEAWLTRAQKRVAKAWLAEQEAGRLVPLDFPGAGCHCRAAREPRGISMARRRNRKGALERDHGPVAWLLPFLEARYSAMQPAPTAEEDERHDAEVAASRAAALKERSQERRVGAPAAEEPQVPQPSPARPRRGRPRRGSADVLAGHDGSVPHAPGRGAEGSGHTACRALGVPARGGAGRARCSRHEQLGADRAVGRAARPAERTARDQRPRERDRDRTGRLARLRRDRGRRRLALRRRRRRRGARRWRTSTSTRPRSARRAWRAARSRSTRPTRTASTSAPAKATRTRSSPPPRVTRCRRTAASARCAATTAAGSGRTSRRRRARRRSSAPPSTRLPSIPATARTSSPRRTSASTGASPTAPAVTTGCRSARACIRASSSRAPARPRRSSRRSGATRSTRRPTARRGRCSARASRPAARRIGLAVQRNNPNVVYALVANSSDALLGVYRLDNLAGAWKNISGAPSDVLGSQGDYDLDDLRRPERRGADLHGRLGGRDQRRVDLPRPGRARAGRATR